jgi:hypothetical protein
LRWAHETANIKKLPNKVKKKPMKKTASEIFFDALAKTAGFLLPKKGLSNPAWQATKPAPGRKVSGADVLKKLRDRSVTSAPNNAARKISKSLKTGWDTVKEFNSISKTAARRQSKKPPAHAHKRYIPKDPFKSVQRLMNRRQRTYYS